MLPAACDGNFKTFCHLTSIELDILVEATTTALGHDVS